MAGIGVVLNLGLNLVLIPKLGITGAALSSSAAYLTVALLMFLQYCKISAMPFYRLLLMTPTDMRQLLGNPKNA